jgi:hypothetical protein
VCVCLLVSFSKENWNSTHKLEINHGATVIISFAALETHQHQTDGQEEEEDFSHSLHSTQQLSGWLRVIAEHQVYIYISGRRARE